MTESCNRKKFMISRMADCCNRKKRAISPSASAESRKVARVNLTTDLDASKAQVFPEGDTFKMVVTAEAHPSFAETRFWWEKDGLRLREGGDLRLSYHEPHAVLEKGNARFDDSGQYTLHARIYNATSRMTINVTILSKPVVTVVNDMELYAYGFNYTLVCTVKGSEPLLRAGWEWRECAIPLACELEDEGFFFKSLSNNTYHKNGPGDGFSLVSSAEGLRHRNLTLRLRAQQSGLYRCVGDNKFGTDRRVAKFYITDAKNGLEIIASDERPVDQDQVWLSCLASQFKYKNLIWRWKAKGSSEFVNLSASDALDIKMSSTAFSNNLTLYFNPIGRNQSGRYECTGYTHGRNTHRRTEFVNIAVQDMHPPVFNRTTLRNDVMSDVSYIDLSCSANGQPEPTITWLKDGKLLNMTGVNHVSQGRRIIKDEVTSRDSGFYQCRAENRAGAIYANATIYVTSGIPAPATSNTQTAWISVVSVAVIIGFLVGLFFYCRNYRAVVKEEKERELLNKSLFDNGQMDMFNPDLLLWNQVELLPYDRRWEFPRDRLKLGRTLGQGAFGRVVKAEAIGLGLNGQSLTVAVKMLKERADMSQRKALMAELKILIHLGRHLNIVNILGAVTKNVFKGELMMIMEYCKFGNLRHFMLRHRERFVNQLNPETGKVDPNVYYSSKSPTSPSSGFPSAGDAFDISNPGYCQQRRQHTPTLKYKDLAMSATASSGGNEFNFPVSGCGSTADGFLPEGGNHAPLMSGSSPRDHGDLRHAALTTCDLLCFAFQCARGMEYLASRKLIHRDLAARNVLLSEENVAKICDFGLAKECYKDSNYIRKGDGLLPVKWTAIESIMDRVFTTKSDVWSYGVLLWEIFSLGGNPYPGVVIDESFYKSLKNGYRMEKPVYAPEDVYEIMKSCWQAEPNERPDFSSLVIRVGDLLEAGVRDHYVALNAPYANANHLVKSYDDYLVMRNNSQNPDYMNMNSDGENNVNTSQAGIEANSEPHYAKTAITNSVPNGAIARDGIEVTHILDHGCETQECEQATTPNCMNFNEPTLHLRDTRPVVLLPPYGATGDARLSDDMIEVCATPPSARNLAVSDDSSGSIDV